MTSRLNPFLLLPVFLLAGCDLLGGNDDPDPTPVPSGILVVNQGNFGDANGSITVYDPAGGTTQEIATDLGSILQSALLIDDRLYVMSNSANRIDVLDANTYQRTGQITGVTSPRYMAQVSASKAYVTNLFKDNFAGGTVTVIDLSTNSTQGTIDVGDNPEGVVVVGDRAFVANHGFGNGTTISIIDTETDEVTETVDAECDGPRTLLADEQDDVFVLCTGTTLYDENFNVIGETNGAVRVLDGTTGAVTARFDLDARIGTAGPGQDAFYAAATEELFAVSDTGLLRFDTSANTPLATLALPAGSAIGAIAFDAATESLYLGRVPGFTDAGTVTVHTLDGAETGRFDAGIAPSHILLRPADP